MRRVYAGYKKGANRHHESAEQNSPGRKFIWRTKAGEKSDHFMDSDQKQPVQNGYRKPMDERKIPAIQFTKMEQRPKFKICLTMAGAVSAGGFTAGVMDYLLETLDLWEKAKQKNIRLEKEHPDHDDSVPMHEVEIDVISGSSAGGITGALTMLNLIDDEHQPVNKDNPFGKHNRFYQSWVEMGDDDSVNTFEKMLATGDLASLKKGEKPKALLNSAAIDIIADNALQVHRFRPYPAYISDSLDLILTTTNLRGINFKIDFGGNATSGPVITSHAGFFRYKLKNARFKEGIPDGDDLYYVLNLEQERDMDYLKNATLSTAAFPIGLRSREVAISQEYINRYPKYLFGKRSGIRPLIKEGTVYKFNSIDGGLINNEPFAIALKVLREKHPAELMRDRYAVIMIDPFPNKDNDIDEENPTADILSVAKGMFRSLRNQVMFNQDGIMDALELVDRTKFLIEPIRKVMEGGEMIRAKNDLASAPFSGFAGFIDRSFRHHDYYLGRQNCQTFLRYYFAVPEPDIGTKLGAVPSAAAMDRFCFHESRHDESSTRLFPIIPDMRVLKARANEVDTEKYGMDAKLNYPEYPSISEQGFKGKYSKAIRKRIEMIANNLVANFWFSIANRLFVRNKVAKEIEDLILKELKEAALIR